jgi:hypothetical protein
MPIPAREARRDAFLDRVIPTAFRSMACILNGPRRYVHRVPTSSRFPGSEPGATTAARAGAPAPLPAQLVTRRRDSRGDGCRLPRPSGDGVRRGSQPGGCDTVPRRPFQTVKVSRDGEANDHRYARNHVHQRRRRRARLLQPTRRRSARILHMHRAQQVMEMLVLGPAWTDAGLVFASSIGTVVEPRN